MENNPLSQLSISANLAQRLKNWITVDQNNGTFKNKKENIENKTVKSYLKHGYLIKNIKIKNKIN